MPWHMPAQVVGFANIPPTCTGREVTAQKEVKGHLESVSELTASENKFN